MIKETASKAKNVGEDACAATLLSGWHRRGYLPHLKAEKGTYFVTFRLADTLPKQVLVYYRIERKKIEKRAEKLGRELTIDETKRLAKLQSENIDSYLDAGHGKCWLKHPEIGRIVAEALQNFDGERYDLHAWVVMPNHVHAVLFPREKHSLSSILQNWKSFTTHQAQKLAPAIHLDIPKGKAFWQRESYDHLIRDDADFTRVVEYTLQNPVKAGLCEKPEDWPYIGTTQVSWLKNAGEDACAAMLSISKNAGEDACATCRRT